MKKTVLLLLFLLPLLAFAWEVTVRPASPRAGEWAYLIFRTEKGESLPDPGKDLPEVQGLHFARNNSSQSSQLRIINGRRSHITERSIPFLASKEGNYTIPLKKLSKWNSSTKESLNANWFLQ